MMAIQKTRKSQYEWTKIPMLATSMKGAFWLTLSDDGNGRTRTFSIRKEELPSRPQAQTFVVVTRAIFDLNQDGKIDWQVVRQRNTAAFLLDCGM